MNNFKELNTVSKITATLCDYYGMNNSSPITKTFAYCIFDAHPAEFLNCDTPEAYRNAITAKRVSEAASVVIRIAKNYLK